MIFSGSLHLFSDFLSTRPSVFLSAELNIISAHPHLTVFWGGRVSWSVLNFSVERELLNRKRRRDGVDSRMKCLCSWQTVKISSPIPVYYSFHTSFFCPMSVLSAVTCFLYRLGANGGSAAPKQY
jgi:hypothetical protein